MNISQMIMKIVPISTRIVISYARKGASCFEFDRKSIESETATWLEFLSEGKAFVEQILASEEINNSKEQDCESQSAAVQIRTGQWSITATLWPLTTCMYYVMIMVPSGMSKKSFFNIFRSSRMLLFFKTGGSFATFTGKHLCWSLFSI